MKILITGAKGMLASQIIKDLQNGYTELGEIPVNFKDATLIAYDADKLDITDAKACLEVILNEKPDVVINCAAITNVDGCETNAELAFKVNSLGAKNIAIACEQANAKLVHVSTDYVFSGIGNVPFCEYDVTVPDSVYGKTKLMGEDYVRQYCKKSYIVRTAWLYGYYGPNFVKTIVKAGTERGELKVVNDQLGNPTNAADLSHHILKIANSDDYGVYHCTGEGECSWYDFASLIIKLAGVNATVDPCTTDEFPRPAKRPAYSSLNNMMLKTTVGNEMRDWQDALKAYFENEKTL